MSHMNSGNSSGLQVVVAQSFLGVGVSARMLEVPDCDNKPFARLCAGHIGGMSFRAGSTKLPGCVNLLTHKLFLTAV